MIPAAFATDERKGNQMKDQIMQNLNAVLAALNTITVSGKINLANLSGCITVIEMVLNDLQRAELIEPDSDSAE